MRELEILTLMVRDLVLIFILYGMLEETEVVPPEDSSIVPPSQSPPPRMLEPIPPDCEEDMEVDLVSTPLSV